jgi:hypothetical protein
MSLEIRMVRKNTKFGKVEKNCLLSVDFDVAHSGVVSFSVHTSILDFSNV